MKLNPEKCAFDEIPGFPHVKQRDKGKPQQIWAIEDIFDIMDGIRECRSSLGGSYPEPFYIKDFRTLPLFFLTEKEEYEV